MFKKKLIFLFLLLGITLFMLVGCVTLTDTNSINAMYIKTHFENSEENGQFEIIDTHNDLLTLLENDAPEKYNEQFFVSNSVLVFKMVESADINKSKIEKYIITDNTLNVYVKTKQQEQADEIGHWWYILELNKEKVQPIDQVIIYKNDIDINDWLNYEVELNIKRSYLSTFCNDLTNLDELLIEKYYGCYNDFYAVLIKEINKGDNGTINTVIIDDLKFIYPFSNREVLLWKDGKFILLPDAYENGLIQKDDLVMLHQKFNG